MVEQLNETVTLKVIHGNTNMATVNITLHSETPTHMVFNKGTVTVPKFYLKDLGFDVFGNRMYAVPFWVVCNYWNI